MIRSHRSRAAVSFTAVMLPTGSFATGLARPARIMTIGTFATTDWQRHP